MKCMQEKVDVKKLKYDKMVKKLLYNVGINDYIGKVNINGKISKEIYNAIKRRLVIF